MLLNKKSYALKINNIEPIETDTLYRRSKNDPTKIMNNNTNPSTCPVRVLTPAGRALV